MKKSIKKFEVKSIQSTALIKGGKGDDKGKSIWPDPSHPGYPGVPVGPVINGDNF